MPETEMRTDSRGERRVKTGQCRRAGHLQFEELLVGHLVRLQSLCSGPELRDPLFKVPQAILHLGQSLHKIGRASCRVRV